MPKPKIPKYLYQVIPLLDWNETKNRKSFNIKQKDNILHLLTKKQFDDIQKSIYGLPNLLIITINTQKLPVAYESGSKCKKNLYYGHHQKKHYHIHKNAITLNTIEKIDLIETHQFDSPNKYGLSLRYLARAADHACNKRDKEKNQISPLHIAAYGGTVKKVKELLKKIDVNSTDKYGWIPLHDAAMQGDPQIVRLLINAGANINAQDKEEKWTPLHDAVRMNHPQIVQMLLDTGANPLIKDKWRKTPKYYAKEYKFNETLKILTNHKKC